MRTDVRHHPGCEKATQHKCVCAQCGGSEHGWRGRIHFAREPSGALRREFRSNAEQKWAKATSRNPKRPTKAQKEAATETAEADMIDWMAEDIITAAQNPSVTAQEIRELTTDQIAEKIGRVLADEAKKALEKYISSLPKNEQLSLMSHFWCDLVAAMACAVQEFRHELDRVPDYAVQLIQGSRSNENHRADEFLTRLAVGIVWKVATKPALHQFDAFLRAIRILGTFICPAPERHRSVIKCCVDPLAESGVEAVVTAITKQRLRQVLPPGWMSDT